jgi:hypothetical protein
MKKIKFKFKIIKALKKISSLLTRNLSNQAT